MANVVLALLTNTQTAPDILAAADRLAVLLGGARIEALVVRAPPISTILVTEEILSRADEQKIRFQEADRAGALRRIFNARLAQSGRTPEPSWIDEEGITEILVKNYGQRADYIVTGRPDAPADHSEHEALYAALFDTDRPVLMIPPGTKMDFGENVAIAWRDDKFTLNALLAALRCLPPMADLHVLMGRRPGHTMPKIPDIIAEHGFVATGHELPVGKNVFGEQLLTTAHALHADMLVMGAFVHSAWHNMLFGGVTKHILLHSDIPVLMRH